ncbi:MAG: AraC family transcriptional regulator ligand-binding domain-containing protein [Myxococcota bacterium]
MLAAAEAVPHGLAALLAATELTPELLADAELRLTSTQLRDAWRALARLPGAPARARRGAAATPPGAFGIVEYVCRSAATVGDALARWVRYLNLLDEVVEVALVDGDGADQVALEVVVESPVPAPLAHELCFALLTLQCRALTAHAPGLFRVARVELTHGLGGDLADYERFFDAPVRFGAERCRLVMPRRALQARLQSADANLLAILVRHADELRLKDPHAPPMTAQVRRVLCEVLREGPVEVATVAARLGLTARSLQRRLKDEESSFQLVRDEVRKELATRYLASGELAIAEISFLLGFSEPSAFFRAYKRWTGQTPIQSRRAM